MYVHLNYMCIKKLETRKYEYMNFKMFFSAVVFYSNSLTRSQQIISTQNLVRKSHLHCVTQKQETAWHYYYILNQLALYASVGMRLALMAMSTLTEHGSRERFYPALVVKLTTVQIEIEACLARHDRSVWTRLITSERILQPA